MLKRASILIICLFLFTPTANAKTYTLTAEEVLALNAEITTLENKVTVLTALYEESQTHNENLKKIYADLNTLYKQKIELLETQNSKYEQLIREYEALLSVVRDDREDLRKELYRKGQQLWIERIVWGAVGYKLND